MDYFNDCITTSPVLQGIKALVPTLEWAEVMRNQTHARQQAVLKAQQHTARSKLLLLTHPSNEPARPHCSTIEIVPTDCTGRLCRVIATSSDRIAAIIMNHHEITPYYARKVRELASAEGALIIWDISKQALDDRHFSLKVPKSSQPDLVCFRLNQYPTLAWLAGREQF